MARLLHSAVDVYEACDGSVVRAIRSSSNLLGRASLDRLLPLGLRRIDPGPARFRCRNEVGLARCADVCIQNRLHGELCGGKASGPPGPDGLGQNLLHLIVEA